ncbi:CDP-glucose 4,6-dehydratase [Agrobacterium genomosp. 13]|uniref:CDP-glucose 4,6-dehydratase n=1 Tax=Agrobacterium genomosp. 13 TaxID=1183419 RepID=UPI0027E3C111|nr:CDP-glucose 4,6-dehydratase [Agrobacterium genomosp. 13]
MEDLGVNISFWRGKRVLLTGHTGFKGSWLSLWLQNLGAHVTGFALPPPTNPSLFEATSAADGMTSLIGDIRDLEALKNAMRTADPEIVIHMAAQPLVRYSYVNPVETFSTNVMGVVNLLEAVRESQKIRAVVNVTTDKCYENREWPWGYRENEPMGGYDPYSSSKACAELVTAAYRRSYFTTPSNGHRVAVGSARAGNVIGGGDWAKDRLIPDIVYAFSQGAPASIRNPQAIRPWQHVLESLRGYLVLAENLFEHGDEFAEAWNFGPNDDDAKPVSWITERMAELWGNEASWSCDVGNHPHEAHFLKLDISKARSRLAWHPELRLDRALQYIVDWSKAVAEGQSERNATIAQIREYQAAIAR